MNRSLSRKPSRPAFSLIEVLVVVGILALLLLLLLPGIQRIREVGSRTTCMNNMRQLSIGLQSCTHTAGQLPSGGWGYNWTGDPNRGVGIKQPGGWIFSLLPFIEQQPLYSMTDFQARNSTPVKIMNCPSRRASVAYPNYYNYGYVNANPTSSVGRTDYAACASSTGAVESGYSPQTTQQGDGIDTSGFSWAKTDLDNRSEFDGPIQAHGSLHLEDIPHGLSTQIMIGEKYLNPDYYLNGIDSADNECMFVGMDNDIMRSTGSPPIPDQPGYGSSNQFGSAHPTGLSLIFGDGSVKQITYSIDPSVFQPLGSITYTAPITVP